MVEHSPKILTSEEKATTTTTTTTTTCFAKTGQEASSCQAHHHVPAQHVQGSKRLCSTLDTRKSLTVNVYGHRRTV